MTTYTLNNDGSKYHTIYARLSGNVFTLTGVKQPHYEELTSTEKSARRAKLHFNDKINALAVHVGAYNNLTIDEGWSLKFLTLTIKSDMGRSRFAYAWKRFRQRLERRLAMSTVHIDKIAYVATVERQKHGRLHLHVCIYCPYIQWIKLLKAWGEGGAYVEKVKEYDGSGLNNLSGYMGKYLSKDIDNTEAHYDDDFGHKRYFSSRNIRRLVTRAQDVLRPEEMNKVTELEHGSIYATTYEGEYNDVYTYYFDVTDKRNSLERFKLALNYTKTHQTVRQPRKRLAKLLPPMRKSRNYTTHEAQM